MRDIEYAARSSMVVAIGEAGGGAYVDRRSGPDGFGGRPRIVFTPGLRSLVVWVLICGTAAVASAQPVDPCASFPSALHQAVAWDAGEVSPPAPPPASPPRICARRALAPTFDLGAGTITSTLLQTAGQVVVDRAVSNAWSLLRDRLRDTAGCSGEPPTFGHVCSVLADVRLQDLIASPQVLLDAAIADVIAKLRGVIISLDLKVTVLGKQVSLSAILVGALDAWRDGGRDAAFAYLRSELLALVLHVSTTLDQKCDTPLCKALRIIGSCLANGKPDANRCALLAASTGFTADHVAVRRNVTAIQRALLDEDLTALIRLFAAELRDHVRDSKACKKAPSECTAFIEAVTGMLEGIAAGDWSRLAAGTTAALQAGAAFGLAVDPKHKKLFALLAGVGQYAATYTDKTSDPAVVAAARRKAIESLIDATTDRSNRTGLVVSVGGDFGIGWGRRHNIVPDGKNLEAKPTPLHLSFGFAIDHYMKSSPYGLHAMVGFADLSQYVAFEDKDFTVVDPDPKASLVLGATVGLRVALRSTPWFVGANLTYAPFVSGSAEGAQGSYQLMVLTAVYVPFFDFN